MLYKEGDLKEDQANRIIGNKMLDRIRLINKWLNEHDYCIMLHSTYVGNINGILSSGLNFPGSPTFDSREDLLEKSNISEKDLIALEEYMCV